MAENHLRDARFDPNLLLLIWGGFKFSQILFFRFRGGTQLFSFSDGDWKMKDELQGWRQFSGLTALAYVSNHTVTVQSVNIRYTGSCQVCSNPIKLHGF